MGGLRLDRRDYLAVDIHNSVSGLVVNISARVELDDGQIVDHRLTVTPAADRSEVNANLPLGPGSLVALSIHPSGATTRRGQTFVYAFLNRDPVDRTFPDVVLVSNYLESGSGLGWPGGTFAQALSGQGHFEIIPLSSPAAGAEFTYTVPSGMALLLKSGTFTLACSSAPGQRTPRLSVSDGSSVFVVAEGSTSVVNDETKRFSIGMIVDSFGGGVFEETIEAPDLVLMPGSVIASDTKDILSADQYSAIVLAGESWLIV